MLVFGVLLMVLALPLQIESPDVVGTWVGFSS